VDADVVLGSGDSTGVSGAAIVEEAGVGTGVEDTTGIGEEDAGGAPPLAGCAVGLPTGAWAKAVAVKKLRALRTKNTFFISNVALPGVTVPVRSARSPKPYLFSSWRVRVNWPGGDQTNKAAGDDFSRSGCLRAAIRYAQNR
jgi:hypothetical protein